MKEEKSCRFGFFDISRNFSSLCSAATCIALPRWSSSRSRSSLLSFVPILSFTSWQTCDCSGFKVHLHHPGVAPDSRYSLIPDECRGVGDAYNIRRSSFEKKDRVVKLEYMPVVEGRMEPFNEPDVAPEERRGGGLAPPYHNGSGQQKHSIIWSSYDLAGNWWKVKLCLEPMDSEIDEKLNCWHLSRIPTLPPFSSSYLCSFLFFRSMESNALIIWVCMRRRSGSQCIWSVGAQKNIYLLEMESTDIWKSMLEVGGLVQGGPNVRASVEGRINDSNIYGRTTIVC